MDRVGSGNDEAENGVAAFVICDSLALFGAEHEWSLGAENDLLERVEEVFLMYLVLIATRGEERRFVHEVSQVRAGDAGRHRAELSQIDVWGERHVTRVHFQNGLAAFPIREVHDDTVIEAAGAEERLVEHVRLIRGGEDDDSLTTREAIHLGEELV